MFFCKITLLLMPLTFCFCFFLVFVQLADIAVDSLCRGVFAGDCRKLSVRSCFPAFHNVEQRRRSLILGMLLDSGTLILKPSCQVYMSTCIYVHQLSIKLLTQRMGPKKSFSLPQFGLVEHVQLCQYRDRQ